MPIFLFYSHDNKFALTGETRLSCVCCVVSCVLFDLSWRMASIILSPLFFLSIFILLVFPTLAHFFHGLHSHPHTSNATDEEALLAFKHAIIVDPLHSLHNWTPNVSFCKWAHVQCSRRRQRVISLNLSSLALEEYGVNGVVSTKGDVYSYGILLLEMVTRKKPTDSMFEEGMDLQKWVSSGFPDSTADVIDSCLLSVATNNEEDKVFKCLKQLISLALVCTRQSPEERPTMIDIVRILHNIRCDYLGDATTSKFQSDLPSLLALSKENFETNDSEISSTF